MQTVRHRNQIIQVVGHKIWALICCLFLGLSVHMCRTVWLTLLHPADVVVILVFRTFTTPAQSSPGNVMGKVVFLLTLWHGEGGSWPQCARDLWTEQRHVGWQACWAMLCCPVQQKVSINQIVASIFCRLALTPSTWPSDCGRKGRKWCRLFWSPKPCTCSRKPILKIGTPISVELTWVLGTTGWPRMEAVLRQKLVRKTRLHFHFRRVNGS